jgi:hypothetical protein
MTKLIACISAALLFVLGGTALAGAATPDSQLLRTYQPVTHFDPLELFGPAGVQSFVSDAVLEQLIGGQWVVVDPAPEPGELPGPGTGTFRLNQMPCSPSAPLGGLSCYQAGWDSGSGGSEVHGRVAHLPGATVLQYWYFYYDDVYSYFYPPSDAIWQAHEGDWEVVNVVLSADEQPVEVAYSQHCLGQRRAWSTTPRWRGTHPVVYVALGSHANYLAPGTHQLNTACIPPPVLALFVQYGLPLPSDYSSADGETAGPPQSGGRVTTIHNADEQSQAWLRFPGFWGELQWFHASLVATTLPLGTSPVGPVYHDVWQNPLPTIATWPQG